MPGKTELRAAARVSIVTFAVAASLLTFPSVLPWMVALWLAWGTIQMGRGRSPWIALTICVVVLLVKRPPLLPAVVAMEVLLITVAVLLGIAAVKRTSPLPRRWSAALLIAIWSGWTFFCWQWYSAASASRVAPLGADRPIVCFGDSLTSGVPPYGGYPDLLGEMLTVPVLNLGRAGISAGDAQKYWPEVLASRPQAIVLELGGHDYLKGHSRASTRSNLETMIQDAQAIGAVVVLVEVPRAFISDPYAGLERELAYEHDLELVSDSAIRWLVLWSPSAPPGMWTDGPYLSDDGLHPNRAGNAVLAAAVARSLRRLYGREIER